jgi:hypothetical protein
MHSPRPPGGDVSCPNSDGSAVGLYFMYPGQATEFVRVALSGCRSVSAPGLAERRASQDLLSRLAAAAPEPWAGSLKAEATGDRRVSG